MAERVPATEVRLSEERRAALAPQLPALLEEFGKLAALEAPDLEPFAPRSPAGGDAHERR